MKLFNLILAALVAGTAFTASFAKEAAPAPAAKKKAAKKKAVKKPKAKPTLEQDITTTTTPVMLKRHIKRMAIKKKIAQKLGKNIKVLMLGDSITHLWDNRKHGTAAWKKYLAPYNALNLGVGGDRTQHTLWIMEKSGILELIEPKVVTIMIGTNNSLRNDHRATIAGVKKIIEGVRARYPEAKVLLFAIFPRGASAKDKKRLANEKVNAEIVKFCDGKDVLWVDIRKDFLTSEGVLERKIMYDLLHLTADGYDIWGKALTPYLEKYAK